VLNSKYLKKYQTRVFRESIPKPWNDVASMLIKYVMLEGRYKILLASHFFMLNHFIFLDIEKINFPFFIFNFLVISVEKFKQEQSPMPLHGVVIKPVVGRDFSMASKKFPRVKVLVGGKIFELGKNKEVGDSFKIIR